MKKTLTCSGDNALSKWCSLRIHIHFSVCRNANDQSRVEVSIAVALILILVKSQRTRLKGKNAYWRHGCKCQLSWRQRSTLTNLFQAIIRCAQIFWRKAKRSWWHTSRTRVALWKSVSQLFWQSSLEQELQKKALGRSRRCMVYGMARLKSEMRSVLPSMETL